MMYWTIFWKGSWSSAAIGLSEGIEYVYQDEEPTYADCLAAIPGFVSGEIFGPNKVHYFLVDNADKVR